MKRGKSLPSEHHWTWNSAAREKPALWACSHTQSKFALFACDPKKASSTISAMGFLKGLLPQCSVWSQGSSLLRSQLMKFCSTTQTAWVLSHAHIIAKLGDDTPPNTRQAHAEITACWLQKVIYSAPFCSVVLQITSAVFQIIFHGESLFYPFDFLTYTEDLLKGNQRNSNRMHICSIVLAFLWCDLHCLFLEWVIPLYIYIHTHTQACICIYTSTHLDRKQTNPEG